MTLKTLEQRFKENSQQIYSKFQNPQALSPIVPDSAASKSSIKNDSRLLPIQSTVRDVRFVSRFLSSPAGVLFIGKQLLLQTGNTFAETRLYNPLSPLLNATPFLHLVRHVGRRSFSLKTPTRENRGALQKETVSGTGRGLLRGLGSALLSPFKALTAKPEFVGGFYKRPEDTFNSGIPLFNTQPIIDRGNVKIRQLPTSALIGIHLGFYNNQYVNSKLVLKEGSTPPVFETTKRIDPSINSKYIFNGTPADRETYVSKMTGTGKLKFSSFNLEKDTTKDAVILNANLFNNYQLTQQIKVYSATSASLSGSLTFKKLEAAFAGNGYFSGSNAITLNGNVTDKKSAILQADNRPKSSGIKDPFNIVDEENATAFYGALAAQPKVRSDGSKIKNDIIRFTFGHPSNNSKIHFRAFINSFKETVKPEFAEQRYIGRTERFVTYSGARRTANLSFNIVAFSQEEIETMWKRVNYLTGLAFPRGASASGFMIPPLFRLTVGGIYENQPVYVDNLEHEFIDEYITFDIDHEVSQYINVNLSVTLLEKESKFYDSPFYAITGNR